MNRRSFIKKMAFLIPLFISLLVGPAWSESGRGLTKFEQELEEAKSYEKEGEYKKAEEVYQKSIEKYSSTRYALEAQRDLVILYINWGKKVEAEMAIDKLVADFSEYDKECSFSKKWFFNKLMESVISSLKCWGDLARDSGRYIEAIDAYEKVVTLFPHFSTLGSIEDAYRSLNAIAGCYVEMGKRNTEVPKKHLRRKFIDICQEIIKENPYSILAAAAQYYLALSYCNLLDFSRAEAEFSKLENEYQYDNLYRPRAAYNIACIYMTTEEYEAALKKFTAILESKDANEELSAAALYQIGRMYYDYLNDWVKAEYAFKKLIKDYPNASNGNIIEHARKYLKRIEGSKSSQER